MWPIGTSMIADVIDTIKVLKLLTYVYRDDAFFFLRGGILAAFPGIR